MGATRLAVYMLYGTWGTAGHVGNVGEVRGSAPWHCQLPPLLHSAFMNGRGRLQPAAGLLQLSSQYQSCSLACNAVTWPGG